MEKSSTELQPAARAPATDRLEDDEPAQALLCVLGAVRSATSALRAGTAVPLYDLSESESEPM
jgi:hypothetical protein